MDIESKVSFRPLNIIADSEPELKRDDMKASSDPLEKSVGQPSFQKYYRRPLAYVCISGGDIVSLIEIPTGLKVLDIPVGHRPYCIDISPDRKYAYVTYYSDSSLSVISTYSNRVVYTIDLNAPPFSAFWPAGVKVSPNGKFIYVANEVSHNISVVDANRWQVVTTIPLPDEVPKLLDISANGRLAFVTLRAGNQVAVVNLDANLPVKYIDVGINPIGIAMNQLDCLALTANFDSSNSLSVLNTSIGEASPNTIATGNNPVDVIISPCGTTAYVSNSNDNTIGIIDLSSHRQTKTITVDRYPYGLALTANGRFLLVSNCYSNSVSIIDTRIGDVIARVDVGEYPQYIAILN
jgi:YVTN family beta-propeller protein